MKNIATLISLFYIVLYFILFSASNEVLTPPILIIFYLPIDYDKMLEYVVGYVKSVIKKILNC